MKFIESILSDWTTKKTRKPRASKVKYWTTPGGRYYKEFYEMYESGSHILVAGSTGSGKSVFINTFLFSILADCSPSMAKFVLIDPKRVELIMYKDLPHTIAYACEKDDIIRELENVVAIMDNRYKDMQKRKIRKYDGVPLYIVIDELGDMMTDVAYKRQITPLLQHIANLGRAANIRLLGATQRPSRETIPSWLTLNINTRIGLHCFSHIESHQIIGINDATELPLFGQMIICTPSGYKRTTVPMIPEQELNERIEYWIKQKSAS